MYHVGLKIYKPGFMKKHGNIKILRYLPLLIFLSALGLQLSGYAEKRILSCTSSGDCDGIHPGGGTCSIDCVETNKTDDYCFLKW